MLKSLLQAQLATVLSAASVLGRCAGLSLALSEELVGQMLDATRRGGARGSDDAWSQLPAAMGGSYRNYVREMSTLSGLSDLITLERLDRLRSQGAESTRDAMP